MQLDTYMISKKSGNIFKNPRNAQNVVRKSLKMFT